MKLNFYCLIKICATDMPHSISRVFKLKHHSDWFTDQVANLNVISQFSMLISLQPKKRFSNRLQISIRKYFRALICYIFLVSTYFFLTRWNVKGKMLCGVFREEGELIKIFLDRQVKLTHKKEILLDFRVLILELKQYEKCVSKFSEN